MRLSKLFKLTTRTFSQEKQMYFENQLVPTLPPNKKEKEKEKDPDLNLLIKNYLLTYPGKEKIINYMDEVQYYDDNPDLQRCETLTLELKNEEFTNLLTFISNNLNRELCNIFFYTCKYIYNNWKNSEKNKIN